MERHKERPDQTRATRGPRHDGPRLGGRSLDEFQNRTDASDFVRDLKDKVVHVTLSDPHDAGSRYAEFDLPVTDFIIIALNSFIETQNVAREPAPHVVASLEEAAQMTPRFTSADELFDALAKRQR